MKTLIRLSSDIKHLKGVGEKRAALYSKLSVQTVGDLLSHYPRDYIDLTQHTPIIHAVTGELVTLSVTIGKKLSPQLIRAGMIIYKVQVFDDSGSITAVFFNSKYSADQLVEGSEYLLYGRISDGYHGREMNSPLFVLPEDCAGLIPVYHQTAGLTGKTIAANVKTALSVVGYTLHDPIPPHYLADEGLMPLPEALERIHFPESREQADSARRRLTFDELLMLQLRLNRQKSAVRGTPPCRMTAVLPDEFIGALPFTPTGAQMRAMNDCLAGLCGDYPMSRMLQGDVGSGKTVVAAFAAFAAAKNGWQSAVMAPTEILAGQHYKFFAPLLEKLGLSCVLLTGSTKAADKKEILNRIQSGAANVVIGTHALIQAGVMFSRLGLVVTDEQHRFGVGQRTGLMEKGDNPHMLVMSATPIPRTLAMVVFGDLELSVLDELPPGRKPVKTYLIDDSKRTRMYGFIKKALSAGQQAYIVCPVIDESEQDLVSLNEQVAALTVEFEGFRVGHLHGRMSGADKDSVMSAFRDGQIELLIATTVIEVGVDVPRATIMVIEDADRYGLSQLHQLRGRVGRGEEESHCILTTKTHSRDTIERLAAFCKTTDGFEIAKQDLTRRGPGDFFGFRQSGLPNLKLAGALTDTELLTYSTRIAETIMREDEPLFLELTGKADIRVS